MPTSSFRARARIFRDHGLWYDAIDAYDQSIKDDPTQTAPYHELAEMFRQLPVTESLAEAYEDLARDEANDDIEYPRESLVSIGASAESRLDSGNRFKLVTRACRLARVGDLSAADFLDIAVFLRAEREPRIVRELAYDLLRLQSVIGHEWQPNYWNFLRHQFAQVAAELGWTDRPSDNAEQRTLRADLMNVLGEVEDPGAIAAAREITDRWFRTVKLSVSSQLEESALKVASQNGDAQLYDKLSSRLSRRPTNGRSSLFSSDNYQYLEALTKFRDPALSKRTLAMFTTNEIPDKDQRWFLWVLLQNPVARADSWAYIKSHWEELVTADTLEDPAFQDSLESFCTSEERWELQLFFMQHPTPRMKRLVKACMRQIDSSMAFEQLQKSKVERWLAEHGY